MAIFQPLFRFMPVHQASFTLTKMIFYVIIATLPQEHNTFKGAIV